MSYAVKALQATLYKLLLIQVVLVAVVAVAYLVYRGWPQALAAVFGGGIAMQNALVSANRLRRASERVNDARGSMLDLYVGAVIRFVATPTLIAIGIVLLKLDAVAIIAGFAVAQVAYFFNR